VESALDPSKVGPARILVDAPNSTYYRLRAIELVVEATSGQYQNKIKQAITFLALARMKHGTFPKDNGPDEDQTGPTRKNN